MQNKYLQRLKQSLSIAVIAGLLLTFINVGAIIASAQADFCSGLSSEFAGFLDCSSSFSSFTEFNGGLTAPDTEGYDQSLTQATDVKTYVKNITNFALGFLGLIAVLIIVYSGFLYVTSRGSDDQMGEAKKGITYALIGIIIIFSSYAIVNTILQAPGGDANNIRQQAGVRGSGPDGTNRAQLANFNTAAEEVKKITNDLLRSYQKNYEMAQRASKLTNYAPNQWTKRSDFLDYLQYLKSELQTIKSQAGFTSDTYLAANYIINNLIDPSIVAVNNLIQGERVQELNNTIGENDFVNLLDDVTRDIESLWNNTFGTSKAVKMEYNCALPPEERSILAGYEECSEGNDVLTGVFVGTITAIASGGIGFAAGGAAAGWGLAAGGTLAGAGIAGSLPAISSEQAGTISIEQSGKLIDSTFDTAIKELLIKRGLVTDFNSNVAIYKSSLEDIDRNIKDVLIGNPNNAIITDTISAIQPDVTRDIFNINNNAFADYSNDNFNNSYISDAIKKLRELYNFLKTLKFTVPIIRADVVSGNAPLIVNFDASDSFDPSNTAINSQNYTWDIVNGGDTTNVSCFGHQNPSVITGTAAVSCVFKSPGVYLPKLTLKSSADDIVAGVSYQNISVSASTAKIKLVANTGGISSTLREYDENGNLQIDINEYSITLEQAREGVTFDASGTDTESGADGRRITSYQWIFNDSGLSVTGSGNSSSRTTGETSVSDTGTSISDNAEKITRKFARRGVINAQLIVTDTKGNIDRKLFTIRITDLVARISMVNGQTSGTPGSPFVFDASASKSDVSPNLSYKWSIVDEGPGGLDNFTQNSFSSENERFTYEFKSPGKKKVTVEVQVDGGSGGKTDSFTQEITINSQKPSALFDVVFPEKNNKPSLVLLDASSSFDPDKGDKLKYSWRIFNATPGTDYQVISGAEALNNPNIFTENPKVELVFKRKGTYKVELTVQDQYEAALRQTAVINRDIVINTVIDVAFDESQLYAEQLKPTPNGGLQATVNFKLTSQNAESASINFGDNSTPKTVRFTNGKAEISHTYTRAGSFEVTVNAKKDSETNEVKGLFIIGGGENPIAIPRVKIGNSFVANLQELPDIYRGSQITFDASGSLNSDATTSNLSYSWNMGDGRAYSTPVVTHTFTDLPPATPGYFEVRLTITDNRDVTKTDNRVIPIKITGAKPQIQTLLAELEPNKETAPINVNVSVVAPVDRDGNITKYRFYYFPINDQNRELGVKQSTSPNTTLTINTFGEAGQEVEYGICVDITDNDDNEVKCKELFTSNNFTKVTVKNGRNDPPTADFRVDRTNIKVGETINFYDLSRDPDGRIIEWTYDFEGDNSFVNDKKYEQGNVSHTYTKKSPRDGYKVRVRVTDDKGATSVSQVRTIFVDGVLADPVAAFTYVTQDDQVIFQDKSKVDIDKGGTVQSYKWDFNALVDSDGDGNLKNDSDSTEKNPKHKYASSGIYEVSLTIKDSEGNESTVTRQVVVQKISAGKSNPFANAESAQAITESTNLYKDILRTVPVRDSASGVIKLTSDSQGKAKIRFNFDHLPTTIKRIILDRNIYFDTNSGNPNQSNYGPGDGVRNNDIDVLSRSNRSFEVIFEKAWAPIRLQIAVEDANGKIYTDQADIIFDSNTGIQNTTDLQAALRYNPTNNLPAFIYFIMLFMISLSSTFILKIKEKEKKGKRKL